MNANEVSTSTQAVKINTPSYLYKVLTIADWEASQDKSIVQLPLADREFIHFSREDQLDRLLTKYWADAAEFVILKVDTSKLPGKMVFEPNPGSSNKYYHLYNGSIPFDAILESQVVNQELN